MEIPTSLQPSPDVLFQEIEGEAVLLNLKSEHYHGLDDVGTRFWQLMIENGNVDTIVERMLAEFEVDEATLRADVTQLVTELTGAGLVIPQE